MCDFFQFPESTVKCNNWKRFRTFLCTSHTLATVFYRDTAKRTKIERNKLEGFLILLGAKNEK